MPDAAAAPAATATPGSTTAVAGAAAGPALSEASIRREVEAALEEVLGAALEPDVPLMSGAAQHLGQKTLQWHWSGNHISSNDISSRSSSGMGAARYQQQQELAHLLVYPSHCAQATAAATVSHPSQFLTHT